MSQIEQGRSATQEPKNQSKGNGKVIFDFFQPKERLIKPEGEPKDTLDPVGFHTAEFKKISLLTPDEERELGKRIQGGKRAQEEIKQRGEGFNGAEKRQLDVLVQEGFTAYQKLMEHNLGLVVKIAYHYNGRGLPLEDLISAGHIGLSRAAEGYDYQRGRFAAYAVWWIRQSINRTLTQTSRAIRIPDDLVKTVYKYSPVINELTEKLGRLPTNEEMAEATGQGIKQVETIQRAFKQQPISLDQVVRDDSLHNCAVTDFSLVEDKALGNILEEQVSREILSKIPSGRTGRTREIIELRYGFTPDGRVWKRSEVAKKFGITREAVRQIEVGCLQKLDTPQNRRLFKDFIE